MPRNTYIYPMKECQNVSNASRHQEVVILLLNLHCYSLRPWSKWTANIGKKYMELDGAALNVNKPRVTSRKTDFPKDK